MSATIKPPKRVRSGNGRFRLPKLWWETAEAMTVEDARMLCRKLGTGQCAAICLQHFSLETTDGKCPEAERVWMKRHEKLVGR